MRYLNNILLLIAASVLVFACSGNVDDQSLPVLTVSDSEIDLASETSAEFTVTYNGMDVTAESSIYSTSSELTLEGNVFTPETTGSNTFVAEYDGKVSLPVNVEVVNSKPSVESKFERHVCIVEFTGAWCINCPGGYDNMMLQLSKPSMAKYGDRLHLAAFHSNLEGTDTLAISATQDLFKLFKGLAYPSFSVDLRDSGLLTSDGIGQFVPAVQSSFNDYGAHCGVAVASTLNAAKTSANVTVTVESEFTSEYRVIVLVVQDRIKGWQKTPTYSDGTSDYTHKHVVRQVVTEYSGTFTGEKITDNGVIAAGTQASKSWDVAVDGKWNLDNTEIYALVLDANGYVNNMNVCAIDGGDSKFDKK